MRERDWTDRPLTTPEDLGGLRLAPRSLPHAVLVSGDLAAACRDLTQRGPNTAQSAPPMVGLAGDIKATDARPCLIRIARDRGVLLWAQAPDVWGWHPAGYATSPASDLYVGIDLSGPAVDYVLAQGTSVDLCTITSPSAAVLFAGEATLITRYGTDWTLWVAPPRVTALVTWLRGADRVIP